MKYHLPVISFQTIFLRNDLHFTSLQLHDRNLQFVLFIGTNVTVASVNPGIVNSTGLRHLPMKTSGFLRFSLGLPVWFMLKTAADGAHTTVYAAVEEKLEGVSGKRYKYVLCF